MRNKFRTLCRVVFLRDFFPNTCCSSEAKPLLLCPMCDRGKKKNYRNVHTQREKERGRIIYMYYETPGFVPRELQVDTGR